MRSRRGNEAVDEEFPASQIEGRVPSPGGGEPHPGNRVSSSAGDDTLRTARASCQSWPSSWIELLPLRHRQQPLDAGGSASASASASVSRSSSSSSSGIESHAPLHFRFRWRYRSRYRRVGQGQPPGFPWERENNPGGIEASAAFAPVGELAIPSPACPGRLPQTVVKGRTTLPPSQKRPCNQETTSVVTPHVLHL